MIIDIDLLLSWGASYKNIAMHETVFQEGTEGRVYYQLVSGSISLVNITDKGGEFIQDIVYPGESFGEFHLFDDSVYSTSAIATKESVVIRLNKSSFLNMLNEHPKIHFAFSKIVF